MDPGWWVLILEAANGDPLRASELERELTQGWWERYLVYRIEKAQAERDEQRKFEMKQRSQR